MQHQNLKEQVRRTVREFHMIRRGDRVVTGVSGGADSVCLLLLLKELAGEFGIQVYAVHVHHGLRKAAEEDAAFTGRLCERLEIPLKIYHVDAAEEAGKRGLGVEEAGRELRYELFDRACREWEREETREVEDPGTLVEKGNSEEALPTVRWKIAVAHHREDSAETVLMNLCRGASLTGLSGIRPVNGKVIRPLIRCSRSEIEAELQRRGQDWRTDESNDSLDYTRNYIRNRILPELSERVNARAAEHICRIAEDLAGADAVLEDLAKEKRESCRIPREKESYSVPSLLALPVYLRNRVLYDILAESCGKKDLASEHVELVGRLLLGGGTHFANLPGGVRAEKVYDRLIFLHEERKEKLQRKNGACGPVKENPAQENTAFPEEYAGTRNIWPERKEDYRMRVFAYSGNPQDIPADPYTKWLDYDRISSFLTFRTRKEGDCIAIDIRGGKGSGEAAEGGQPEYCRKKLTRVMIDERIPAAIRGRMVLPADGNRILWVPGYRIGADYKISGATRMVLELSLEGTGPHVTDRNLKRQGQTGISG